MVKKNNLRLVSFGIKNKISNVKLVDIRKQGNNFQLCIQLNKFKKYFVISNNFQNNIYNSLTALAIMSIFTDICQLNKDIFLSLKCQR